MALSQPKDCNCGKKPAPLGRPVPTPTPAPKSLVASMGSGPITHVLPNGTRKPVTDMLAGKAALIREGGSLDFA